MVACDGKKVWSKQSETVVAGTASVPSEVRTGLQEEAALIVVKANVLKVSVECSKQLLLA